MKYIGGFVTVVFMMILGIVCNGFVISKLWGWFMVPLFGLPTLSIAYACGLAMVGNIITGTDASKTKEIVEKGSTFGQAMLSCFCYVVGRTAVALFFGWIIQMFC